LLLHGVQDIDIINNSFSVSAPIRIVHTVGVPSTVLTGNSFDADAQPMIEELFYKGPSRADIQGTALTPAKIK
jgi:hypothetical protein